MSAGRCTYICRLAHTVLHTFSFLLIKGSSKPAEYFHVRFGGTCLLSISPHHTWYSCQHLPLKRPKCGQLYHLWLWWTLGVVLGQAGQKKILWYSCNLSKAIVNHPVFQQLGGIGHQNMDGLWLLFQHYINMWNSYFVSGVRRSTSQSWDVRGGVSGGLVGGCLLTAKIQRMDWNVWGSQTSHGFDVGRPVVNSEHVHLFEGFQPTMQKCETIVQRFVEHQRGIHIQSKILHVKLSIIDRIVACRFILLFDQPPSFPQTFLKHLGTAQAEF